MSANRLVQLGTDLLECGREVLGCSRREGELRRARYQSVVERATRFLVAAESREANAATTAGSGQWSNPAGGVATEAVRAAIVLLVILHLVPSSPLAVTLPRSVASRLEAAERHATPGCVS
jgi:hypothetical protein